MSENVIRLVTDLGDGAVIDADQVLENNKGEFDQIVLVGRRPDGALAVAGTHGAGDSVLLLEWGKSFLVQNMVAR